LTGGHAVPDEPVRIVRSDPAWPARFEEERRLLEEALAPWLVAGVHHIGSTAVPGLAAKPTIDIMAGVESLEGSLAAREPLAALGYEWSPYKPEEFHWFCKPSRAHRTHHLMLVSRDAPGFAGRLAFRDALRSDPALRAEYEAVKRRLAGELGHDRHAYTREKSAYVERRTAEAVARLAAAGGRS
jgi:GrpB-like predicted nucleotidyltransferase (UPF0157 family)